MIFKYEEGLRIGSEPVQDSSRLSEGVSQNSEKVAKQFFWFVFQTKRRFGEKK